MSTTSDFALFTSLRYDPVLLFSRENIAASGLSIQSPLYLLSFNRDRMLAAATHFNWPGSATTVLLDLNEFNRKLLDTVETYFHEHRGERTPLKLKAILTPVGNFSVEASAVPAVPQTQLFSSSYPPPPSPESRTEDEFKFILDTEATTQSPFTSHKTTVRDMYDASRARTGIQSYAEKKEVVLWNDRGEVMEGSLTSVYVWRDGEGWVTPVLSSGGQGGATRRWSLEKGMAKEGVVGKEEVQSGRWMLASNAVRGWWGGWVV